MNNSPRPWRIKESALTQQLMIVDADGFNVAFVNATSKGERMPTTENAMRICRAVNLLHLEETDDHSDASRPKED